MNWLTVFLRGVGDTLLLPSLLCLPFLSPGATSALTCSIGCRLLHISVQLYLTTERERRFLLIFYTEESLSFVPPASFCFWCLGRTGYYCWLSNPRGYFTSTVKFGRSYVSECKRKQELDGLASLTSLAATYCMSQKRRKSTA